MTNETYSNLSATRLTNSNEFLNSEMHTGRRGTVLKLLALRQLLVRIGGATLGVRDRNKDSKRKHSLILQ